MPTIRRLEARANVWMEKNAALGNLAWNSIRWRVADGCFLLIMVP